MLLFKKSRHINRCFSKCIMRIVFVYPTIYWTMVMLLLIRHSFCDWFGFTTHNQLLSLFSFPFLCFCFLELRRSVKNKTGGFFFSAFEPNCKHFCQHLTGQYHHNTHRSIQRWDGYELYSAEEEKCVAF